MMVMTTWKKMTGLIKEVGFNWFLELSRMRRKQRGSRIDRAYRADDSATSKRQSTCHLAIAISPQLYQTRPEIARPAVVEAAEMWSVDASRAGHFLITEHVEWKIDTSARSYLALL